MDQYITRTWLDGRRPVRVDARVATVDGEQKLAIDLELDTGVRFSAYVTDRIPD